MKETIRILVPLKGTCPVCGAMHGSEQPHELHSLMYRVCFFRREKRMPIWWDSIMECPDDVRKEWIQRMMEKTLAADPEGWVPVAERMPTIEDADVQGCVEAWHVLNHVMIVHWSFVTEDSLYAAWRRTPAPPVCLSDGK